MQIGGFQKFSINNFPGLTSAVIFTQGCNFNCPYCHNYRLIPLTPGTICENEVLDYIHENRDFLDGVVISGGEPSIQKDLFSFLEKIMDFQLKIKIDTNGSQPEVIQNLINSRLADYIALDIKSPPAEYHWFSGDASSWDKVSETLDILRQSGVDYELRTTSREKPGWITEILLPGEKWYWQEERRRDSGL
jgi:pyruvate formate lyase activating enzyme